MIANILLLFAALVVFLTILTLAATMLSSGITAEEERYESMLFDASSVEITDTQVQSEPKPVGVFSTVIAEARDPANS